MSDHTTDKQTLAEKINAFLSRYRIALVVVSVVLIVGIVASVLVAQWLSARSERSAEAAEAIESLWQEWQAEQPGSGGEVDAETTARIAEIEEELRAAIADTTERFGGSYGGMRALLTLGLLEWESENFSAARDAFLELADTHAGTYIEAIAVANAAATAEELGDLDQAEELYGRVVTLENAPNLERPHALFSLGRIAESNGEYDLALDYYNQLLDEHGDSNWTNLGRNRIIWLTSQGVGSED